MLPNFAAMITKKGVAKNRLPRLFTFDHCTRLTLTAKGNKTPLAIIPCRTRRRRILDIMSPLGVSRPTSPPGDFNRKTLANRSASVPAAFSQGRFDEFFLTWVVDRE